MFALMCVSSRANLTRKMVFGLIQMANSNFTTSFEEAEQFLSGEIRYDGCSNWNWHTDKCMMHCCGRQAALDIGRLLEHLYDITEQRLPTYNSEIAC